MRERDRLAGLGEVKLTRRQVARSFALATLGLAVAPDLALGASAVDSPSSETQFDVGSNTTTLRYTVQRGDTLRAIAARYGTTVDDIVRTNPALATNPNRLIVGQVIGVPQRGSAQPTAVPPQPTPDASAAAASGQGSWTLPANLPAYQATFLQKAIGPAIQSMIDTGVPASVTLAQAILESDWGRSTLSTEAQNYFGIKGTNQPGPAGVVWMPTYEAGIGYVTAPFRAYDTMVESFVDHGQFLSENSRYAGAMAVKSDARAFARAIQAAGYATAPTYASSLISLMAKFNLEQYDSLD